MDWFERAVIALLLCLFLALSALTYSFWRSCPPCGPAKYSLGLGRDSGRILPFTGYSTEILNRFECVVPDGKQCPVGDARTVYHIDEPSALSLVSIGLVVLAVKSL